MLTQSFYTLYGDGLPKVQISKLVQLLPKGSQVATESCFYILANDPLSDDDTKILKWILGDSTSKSCCVGDKSRLTDVDDVQFKTEVGPRLEITTPFSTNAVSACRAAGLHMIQRIEKSIRYMIRNPTPLPVDCVQYLESCLYDRMTECVYSWKHTNDCIFHMDIEREPVKRVEVMQNGVAAMRQANEQLGLSFDEWDLEYYSKMFMQTLKRNPTDVELFDLAQSNSEHSRHWFFKGRMLMDDMELQQSLFQMIMDTQNHTNDNNVIKFCDNSSAIQGYPISYLGLGKPDAPFPMNLNKGTRHIIFTAETHNFPTGVSPFPGAATGTGGRIRDVHATGRGAHEIAGSAGYCVGNLNIPGYELPWEKYIEKENYPNNFAKPLDIIIQASNGASDYGNKFGEPVICGFARSYGGILPDNERVEYIKPIMFSGGIGSIEEGHISKELPAPGMLLVKLGGPIYRIGVGGGSASSVHVQGGDGREKSLDFGAVQRGDPQMEQKLHRAIRAAVEMGEDNPILSIHDQGAGGNGNVLKELVEGGGAVVECDAFELGDPSISVRELWGAEYQESDAALVSKEQQSTMIKLCRRERCPVSFVGRVTGDNKMILKDFSSANSDTDPVEFDLEQVLGSMPRKVFNLHRTHRLSVPLKLPENLKFMDALNRVLRLPSVASKRYLTNKVDRSVTGLIAQQQCVGPLHTPVADCAVVALSYFDTRGAATAIGEQPVKGLVDAAAGARMAVGEALTNLVFTKISSLRDVKCSGNWMWPAKLDGEGAKLVEACLAMCSVMKELGIAIDGGKDSLSMAARVNDKIVKAPGTLVISAYAPCPDIRVKITPDLKCSSDASCDKLLYIPFGSDYKKCRLGGSALAQCYGQIGNVCPDMDSPVQFANAFIVTQTLIEAGTLQAGHDLSDGGLIGCILEMAFAGNCAMDIDLPIIDHKPAIEALFSEELAIVVQVTANQSDQVISMYKQKDIQAIAIGQCYKGNKIRVCYGGKELLNDSTYSLRDIWEETSFELEKLQCTETQVTLERSNLLSGAEPVYDLQSYFAYFTQPDSMCICLEDPPRVAVIREEGCNGDREMAAAFYCAGFQVWDVTMQDLLDAKCTLRNFRGVAFVGGFSYADVLGSAKGWAASILFHDQVKAEFDDFYRRKDTFSLGVCNGCQLMALLGWVGNTDWRRDCQVTLTHNDSGRFESRFSTVKIMPSPSIMLNKLQGCTVGVWVSHGEGKFHFKSTEIASDLEENDLMCLRYVDAEGEPTESYPYNPNGSSGGLAGLCSSDGRHLALMPHPERCFLKWQWPHWPQHWDTDKMDSPWMSMFTSAAKWCAMHKA